MSKLDVIPTEVVYSSLEEAISTEQNFSALSGIIHKSGFKLQPKMPNRMNKYEELCQF
jgi:hypothetical protein